MRLVIACVHYVRVPQGLAVAWDLHGPHQPQPVPHPPARQQGRAGGQLEQPQNPSEADSGDGDGVLVLLEGGGLRW